MCLFLRNFSVIILRDCQIIQSLLMPKMHSKEQLFKLPLMKNHHPQNFFVSNLSALELGSFYRHQTDCQRKTTNEKPARWKVTDREPLL